MACTQRRESDSQEDTQGDHASSLSEHKSSNNDGNLHNGMQSQRLAFAILDATARGPVSLDNSIGKDTKNRASLQSDVAVAIPFSVRTTEMVKD